MLLENLSTKFPLPAPEPMKGMDSAAGILIVEDDEFVREAMAEILKTCGYQIFKAKNSAEAMDVFQKYEGQIELLVCDVVIPGRNGCELGKLLRKFSPELKILYVSGYAQNTISQQAALDESSHFVPKPFSLQALVEAVNQIFQEQIPSQQVRRASCSG